MAVTIVSILEPRIYHILMANDDNGVMMASLRSRCPLIWDVTSPDTQAISCVVQSQKWAALAEQIV